MYDLINETLFDLEKSPEYILSIQVALDGFSFSVVSSTDNKLLAFKKTPLEISDEKLITNSFKEWIDSNEIFQNSFKTIRIILFQEKFTIVPNKYYSDQIKYSIPSLLFSADFDDFKITENKIESLNAKLLFAITEDLKAFLNKRFGKYRLLHPVTITSKHLPKSEEKNGLVLLSNSNLLYIVFYTGNNILLANSYKINHANDIIYYTLAVIRQLKTSIKSTDFFYAGKLYGGKDTLSQLENHFGSVHPFTCTNPPEFDEGAEYKHLLHQNLSLFN